MLAIKRSRPELLCEKTPLIQRYGSDIQSLIFLFLKPFEWQQCCIASRNFLIQKQITTLDLTQPGYSIDPKRLFQLFRIFQVKELFLPSRYIDILSIAEYYPKMLISFTDTTHLKKRVLENLLPFENIFYKLKHASDKKELFLKSEAPISSADIVDKYMDTLFAQGTITPEFQVIFFDMQRIRTLVELFSEGGLEQKLAIANVIHQLIVNYNEGFNHVVVERLLVIRVVCQLSLLIELQAHEFFCVEQILQSLLTLLQKADQEHNIYSKDAVLSQSLFNIFCVLLQKICENEGACLEFMRYIEYIFEIHSLDEIKFTEEENVFNLLFYSLCSCLNKQFENSKIRSFYLTILYYCVATYESAKDIVLYDKIILKSIFTILTSEDPGAFLALQVRILLDELTLTDQNEVYFHNFKQDVNFVEMIQSIAQLQTSSISFKVAITDCIYDTCLNSDDSFKREVFTHEYESRSLEMLNDLLQSFISKEDFIGFFKMILELCKNIDDNRNKIITCTYFIENLFLALTDVKQFQGLTDADNKIIADCISGFCLMRKVCEITH